MELINSIATVINFILLLGTCVGLLPKLYKSIKGIADIKDDIYEKLDDLNKEIAKLDENQCKNYLVRFLSDVEAGETIDEVERERAYEVHDRYIREGHNGYIKARWNKCVEKGIL